MRLLIIIILLIIAVSGCISQIESVCKGKAKCFTADMEEIIDGDTFLVGNEKIRLSLVDTPEKGEDGYQEAKDFILSTCPLGSEVLVDQDDIQLYSYDRIMAVAYCNGKNLNEELLKNNLGKIYTDFCSKSEFGIDKWAKDYGC